MRKGWRIFFGCIAVLVILYLVGPRPSPPVYNSQLPAVPADPVALTQYIALGEAMHKVKPDNEARIVWADSTHRRTPYVLLYLHGFSASQEEGNPVDLDFARKYGCNVFLSRLADHGIDTPDAMINFTAERLWNSGKEAYAIAKQLGDSIILMGTSTGGTLSLQLAAAYPQDPIKGLVLMSPNIEINNPAAWVLNKPWGLQIARLVRGSKFYTDNDTLPLRRQYWNMPYRLEALVQLQELLVTSMTKETFSKVHKPVLLMYYYADEQHQDPTVKVSGELRMFAELGTPDSLKRQVDIPKAGTHVIGCYITSHDLPSVESALDAFAKEVLHLTPHG